MVNPWFNVGNAFHTRKERVDSPALRAYIDTMAGTAHTRVPRSLRITLLSALTAMAALGWGTIGHYFINTKAVDNLPPAMAQFINSRAYFGLHASDADNRKGTDPTEGPKHFIDIDWYPDFQSLGANPDSLRAIYGASLVSAHGILPWATVQTYDSLVAALRREDYTRADSVAADLGHYVGDGHQPLHVALNYDGQLTGNDGIHSRYETTMINAYASQLTVTPVPAVYVSNRFAYVMAYLLVSHSLVDSILIADNGAKSVSGWNGSGSPPSAYTAELWSETRSLTLRVMQAATVSLGDLWYSAWFDAGLIASAPVSASSAAPPAAFALEQNFPNPFNPSTAITYRVPAPGRVTLTVYSVTGAKIAVPVDAFQIPGEYTVRFDGSALSSGVYFYCLREENRAIARKMLVVR
jgi:hypothetical protein